MSDVQKLLKKLELTAHPMEGGFFRETYRSSHSTAIYYLLTPETFSAMHTLPSDEIFHFYLGDPVEMLQLKPDGSSEIITIGSDVLAGMQPQVVVPGGVWQGAKLKAGGEFGLLGTTMAPGFAYEDYVEGKRDVLCKNYPEFEKRIMELTRPS